MCVSPRTPPCRPGCQPGCTAVRRHGVTWPNFEVERQYRDMRILGIGGAPPEILTALAAKPRGINRDRAAIHTGPRRFRLRRGGRDDEPRSTRSTPTEALAGRPQIRDARGKLTPRERIEPSPIQTPVPGAEPPLAAYGSNFRSAPAWSMGQIGARSAARERMTSPTTRRSRAAPAIRGRSKDTAGQPDAFETGFPPAGGPGMGPDLPTQKEIFIPGGQMFATRPGCRWPDPDHCAGSGNPLRAVPQSSACPIT